MTPKQEAALRQALDCVSTLANARDWVGCAPNERWDEDEMYAELCNATICLKKSLSIIQEALAEQPAQQQEPVEWGVDWGKAGDQSCVSIIKRLPGGGIEVLATEYGPPASKPHDCARSHPHENMDAMCELRTEIARLTNENARLKLQRGVS